MQMDDYNIDCEKCEYGFYQIIDLLIKDIQKLELKVVRLRYLLSGFFQEHDGKMLKCELFSDLSGGYYEQPAYEKYISNYCDGQDPMDSADFVKHLMKVSRGEDLYDF
jgi:hypothetical protein